METAIGTDSALASGSETGARTDVGALEFGVSVVICTHNGASRLPAALDHLKRQRGCANLKWELLIVDNASTDGGGEVARRYWNDDPAASLRIVREPRLGLTFARECALEAVRYALVSFIDDDNWVADNWVARVAEIMTAHPEAAAVGGYCEAVPEVAPPQWFARFRNYYAIGPDYRGAAEVPMLWGAGLNLRKSVWRDLRAGGFSFLTTAQCEDQEICLAARLAGWKLRFDPRLTLQHFVPASRLTWDYFRALQRKRTRCLVLIDPYLAALERPSGPAPRSFNGAWLLQFGLTVRSLLISLIRRPHKLIGRSSPRYEGDDDILRIENYLGRLDGLLRERKAYDRNLASVASARWRNSAPAVRA